jgi:hypothetical protein
MSKEVAVIRCTLSNGLKIEHEGQTAVIKGVNEAAPGLTDIYTNVDRKIWDGWVKNNPNFISLQTGALQFIDYAGSDKSLELPIAPEVAPEPEVAKRTKKGTKNG